MNLTFQKLEELIVYTSEVRFKGLLNLSKTKELLQQVEDYVIWISDSVGLRRRVFHLTVEMLRNLGSSQDQVSFYFKQTHDKIYLLTQNSIYKESMAKLTSAIDGVNELSDDRKKLNQHYKNILRGGQLSERGGASVGLIDLVRKSRNKLLYNFKEVDKYKLKFSLIVQVELVIM